MTNRGVLAVGPIVLSALFLARAVTPVVSVMLLSVFALLFVSTVAVVLGSRIGAAGLLLLGLALFRPVMARELAFDLSSVDSTAWRWWAVGSLLALGWSLVASAVVLIGSSDRAPAPAVALAGLALGAGLLPIFAAIAPQPGFGSDLSEDEMAALPVIEMLNYRFEPPIVSLDAEGVYRAKVENSSDLPHTITIEAIDLEVLVPAGRWAILEIDGAELAASESLELICTVADHRDRGMRAVLEIS